MSNSTVALAIPCNSSYIVSELSSTFAVGLRTDESDSKDPLSVCFSYKPRQSFFIGDVFKVSQLTPVQGITAYFNKHDFQHLIVGEHLTASHLANEYAFKGNTQEVKQNVLTAITASELLVNDTGESYGEITVTNSYLNKLVILNESKLRGFHNLPEIDTFVFAVMAQTLFQQKVIGDIFVPLCYQYEKKMPKRWFLLWVSPMGEQDLKWLSTYSQPQVKHEIELFADHSRKEKELFQCILSQQKALAQAESSQVKRKVLNIIDGDRDNECKLVLDTPFRRRASNSRESRKQLQLFRSWFKCNSKVELLFSVLQGSYTVQGVISSPTATNFSEMRTVNFRRVFSEDDILQSSKGTEHWKWLEKLKLNLHDRLGNVFISSNELPSVGDNVESTDDEDDDTHDSWTDTELALIAARDRALASVPLSDYSEVSTSGEHPAPFNEISTLLTDQTLLDKQKEPIYDVLNFGTFVIVVFAAGGTGKTYVVAKSLVYLHCTGLYSHGIIGLSAETNHTVLDMVQEFIDLSPGNKDQVLLLRSTTSRWRGEDNNPLWAELGIQAHIRRLDPSLLTKGDELLIAQFLDLMNRNEHIDVDDTAVVQLVVKRLGIQFVAGTKAQWLKHKHMKRRVKFFFIDEASQMNQITVRNLLKNTAARVMLVGDIAQLSPYVTCRTGMTPYGLNSTLKHIIERGVTKVHILDKNMRSHPTISHFTSKLLYNGQVAAGVSYSQRNLFTHPDSSGKLFPLVTKEYPIILIHATSRDQIWQGTSRVNWGQQDLAIRLAVACHNFSQTQVMIETPYLAAQGEMQNILTNQGYSREQIGTTTVEGFQGEQASVMIFPTIRTEKDKDKSFVLDPLRLGTAITRPVHLLIIIGDCNYLNKEGLPGDIIAEISANSIIVGDNYVTEVEAYLTHDCKPMYHNGLLIHSDLSTTIGPAWVLLGKGKRKADAAEPFLLLGDLQLGEPSSKKTRRD